MNRAVVVEMKTGAARTRLRGSRTMVAGSWKPFGQILLYCFNKMAR